jgi:anti-sigma factor RsiW
MNPKQCAEIQACFSSYLDGAISGHEMLEVSRHTESCEACARELAAWRLMQTAVSKLGPAKAPVDLGLKLRLAISRERVRRESRLLDRISLMWDNSVRPMMVQVSAGFAGTVVLGGISLLLGVVAAPRPVLANDEPLGALTAPHYLYSTVAPGDIVTSHGSPIVVEASVDAAGRVYDFTIVSGPEDGAIRTRVADQLLGSVFQPASAFGVPIPGRVVVTFSGISVRG